MIRLGVLFRQADVLVHIERDDMFEPEACGLSRPVLVLGPG
jgi:hypothetical protein